MPRLLARVASALGLLHPPRTEPTVGVSLVRGWPYPALRHVRFPDGLVDAFRLEIATVRFEPPWPLTAPAPRKDTP